jgi:hypothetical protein
MPYFCRRHSNPHEKNIRVNDAPPDLIAWQYKLLPLMSFLVIALAGYFVYESMGRIRRLESFITAESPAPVAQMLPADSLFRTPGGRDAARFRALASLELRALDHRYHQSNLTLMTRAWTRYMAFVTGMVLALIGAAFVLGRITEPASKLEAGGDKGRVNLESASPGLFLALFGTVLMGMAILTHLDLTFSDQAIYVGQGDSVIVSAAPSAALSRPRLNLDSLSPSSGRP